jgi:hypothetical protein
MGVLLKQVYDIPLFVPLWLEERLARKAKEVGLSGRVIQ